MGHKAKGMDGWMIPDKTIADSMSKLVDCKFSLGDESKGWDCLNSLKEFYEGCGVKFPREFEDFNEENYAEKWVYDPEIGRQTLFRFLTTLGKSVDKHYAIRGDLLILKHEMTEKPPTFSHRTLNHLKEVHPFMRRVINDIFDGKQVLTFPAIYLGNGNIFLIFEKGGKVVPYKFFKKYVVDVRRLG